MHPNGHYKGEMGAFEAEQPVFLDRFLTQDECWVHHDDPEAKTPSVQWMHTFLPPSKKAMAVPSPGIVMMVFWGMQRG